MLSAMCPPLGTEPMTLGSPTSPKPGPGAQFLPGFLMGDLPAPVTPQPRSFGVMEMRSPFQAGEGEFAFVGHFCHLLAKTNG